MSEAGGLGGLALTWREPAQTGQLISEVRRRTARPFYGNFVLHFEPSGLGAALEAGLPIVTFSWGDPDPYIGMVRDAGALLGIQATSKEAAMRMLEHEPDFMIVQGIEAGGHVQSHRPLDDALAEVLAIAGKTPLFAAGGLATGADLARVLKLGARAGIFGSRFVASKESEAHPGYKQELTEVGADQTALTVCFDGDWPGAMHRVLRNSTFTHWESAGCPPNGRRPGERDVLGRTGSGVELFRYDDAMPRRDTIGDWEAMCLYAGTSINGIGSILSAADLVQSMWAEAQIRLNIPTS